MKTMIEEWRDIIGYEGLYMISNQGRVKSLSRLVRHPNGKIIRTTKETIVVPGSGGVNGDRLKVRLCLNGVIKWKYIHRIVYETFVGDINGQIDHINNDPKDNRLVNLQDISARQNAIKYQHTKEGKASKFVGVHKNGKGWMSMILVNHKRLYLGTFDNEFDAHLAYQRALKSSVACS